MKHLVKLFVFVSMLFGTMVNADTGYTNETLAWDLHKKIACAEGVEYGAPGVRLTLASNVISFPTAAVAAQYDLSACNIGAVIPPEVNYHRQSEILPWLASMGYTNINGVRLRSTCRVRYTSQDATPETLINPDQRCVYQRREGYPPVLREDSNGEVQTWAPDVRVRRVPSYRADHAWW